MLFGKYRFYCRFQADAVLPYYKGSTFHGVFGRALKSVVCALKRQECKDCLLRERCVYALAFEALPEPGEKKYARIAARPHPFVIEPPLSRETSFPRGSSFDFSFLLFGEANRNLPYFVYALERMGEIGIGKKVNGKRGQFVLEKVESKGSVIYSEHDQKLKMSIAPDSLTLQDEGADSTDHLRMKLTLITPLRLKFQNRLHAELPFHVLVRAMLRRVSSLLNFYGEGEPALDYRGLVRQAEDVSTVDSSLKWFDWQRYSSRQEQKMLMGGMTGSITYAGKVGPFLPLLTFCEEAHLGKQTTFGLGQIKFEVVN